VTGTVSDTNKDVWVNGVQATVTNGNWSAAGVPVNSSGSASVSVQAYPSGSAPATTPPDGGQNSVQPQPPTVKLAAYEDGYHYWENVRITDLDVYQNQQIIEHVSQDCWKPESDDSSTYWVKDIGGSYKTSNQWPTVRCTDDLSTDDSSEKLSPDEYSASTEWKYSNFDDSGIYRGDPWTEHTHIRSKVVLDTGGHGEVGMTRMYLVLAQVMDEDTGLQLAAGAVRFMNQLAGTATEDVTNNNDGSVWSQALVSAPAGVNVGVVPKAAGNISFNGMQASNVVLVSQTVAVYPYDLARTNLGVGEQVNLFFVPELHANATWSTTAGSLSVTSGKTNLFTAPSNAANVTVTATISGKSISKSFNVFEPSGIDHGQITYNYSTAFPVGYAAAKMDVSAVIAPTNVSFYRVCVMEVPGPATNVTGIFTNNPPYHSTAGFWSAPLAQDNHFTDSAGTRNPPGRLPPFNAGGFDWIIHSKWQIQGSLITNSFTQWTQSVQIFTNGDVIVSKFGRTLTRTTNNVITTN